MNRGGEVAFLGGLAGGDANVDIAVFRVAGSGTATSRLVTEGEVAPGGDGVLGELGELRINGAGDVAFSARLRNTDGLPDTPFAGSTALDDSALYLARANGTLHGAVDNQGTLHVSPGQALSVDGDLLNGGEIRVDADASVRYGGTYSGSGLISGAGTSLFDGGLDPGDSPTLMQVAGDVVLGAGNETVLEIAGLARGTQYDALDVEGRLMLGGALRITLLDGFALAPGQDFLLFDAGLLDGDFATLLLPQLDGIALSLQRDSHSLRLAVQAVPVPGMAWLFAAAVGMLGARRRVPWSLRKKGAVHGTLAHGAAAGMRRGCAIITVNPTPRGMPRIQ